MGSFAAAFIGLAILSAPDPVLHLQGGAVIGETSLTVQGITFPTAIGGFTRGGSRDYESNNPGLGSSVAYYFPDTTATVYVYDKRMPNIPSGSGSAVVQAEIDLALRDIAELVQRGFYQTWKLGERGEFKEPVSGLSYQYAELELVRRSRPANSYVFVTGYRGKFLKIRITAETTSGSGQIAKDFVANLSKLVTHESPTQN